MPRVSRWWILLLACVLVPAFAQEASEPPLYVADVTLESAEELTSLLERAETLLLEGARPPSGSEPRVSFVLHGPVLENLVRDAYLDNKQLVDQAAAMSALEFIEIKACRTWIRSNGLTPEEFHPFLDMVELGAAEVTDLVENKGRIYF